MERHIDRERLRTLAAAQSVLLDEGMLDRLDTYARMLVEWNERMNLTAITDSDGILRKHFLDSLSVAPYLPQGPLTLIDVGTGAGFPGMVLAIFRPELRLTLLDSLQKRLTFLEALCGALELPVTLVHARAEEGGRRPELRERFDVATARAVAAMPVLCEYCLPYVRVGGQFIAMKGRDGEAELVSAQRALARLGGDAGTVHAFTLPPAFAIPAASGIASTAQDAAVSAPSAARIVQDASIPQPAPLTQGASAADNTAPPAAPGEQRRILCIKKRSATSDAYPRASAKIAKQPL